MYQNAKRYFITAKELTTAEKLIEKTLSSVPQAIKSIKSGGVWLNNHRLLDETKQIKKGETLKVYVSDTQGKYYQIESEEIKYETRDFIVVTKPSGLSTVPDRSNLYWNLSYGVQFYLESKGLSYCPQAITRLDLMVSGLVLFPKHKAAEKEFFQLTKDRRIHKSYHADLPYFSDPPRYLRVKDKIEFKKRACVSETGKSAHSLFILQKKTDESTRYTVILFTGRRHQIRCHSKHYLRPILGDLFYNSKTRQPQNKILLEAIGLNFWYKNKKYRIRL